MPRLASIDIGSNSMHLYVVDVHPDGSWNTVRLLRSSIRLGEGWKPNQQRISTEKMHAAIEAIAGFVSQALLLNADAIQCSATAALRDAENRIEFESYFEKELGHSLRVLSGVEEAAIVYKGTRAHVPGDILMFDLGGRSTELVFGRESPAAACMSLPIGHLALFSICPYEQPVSDTNWQRLVQTATEYLEPINPFPGDNFILCSPSGAVRTLARMAAYSRGETPKGRGSGLVLTEDALLAEVTHLQECDALQLRNIPGGDARRVDTLLAAAAIIHALMLRFSQFEVLASHGGLRDGLVMEWAEGLEDG